jgi:hypothetical protein
LILKLIPVSAVLGICGMLGCVQSVFKCIVLKMRQILSATFYNLGNGESWNLRDLPQTVRTMSVLAHHEGLFQWQNTACLGLQGTSDVLACMVAFLGLGM